VSFEDARGQRSYVLDGKTVKITVAGAEVSTKSRRDKTVLKQEFSTAEQADRDLGRRRERPAGARRKGRKPQADDAGPESRVRDRKQ
jgi:hypothetical protein